MDKREVERLAWHWKEAVHAAEAWKAAVKAWQDAASEAMAEAAEWLAQIPDVNRGLAPGRSGNG